MSLAEIFLLLVFTILLVAAHKENTDGPIEVERLRRENAKLSAENAVLRGKVNELSQVLDRKNAIIDVLASMAGVPIDSAGDVPNAINALRRGAKACTKPNTLIAARASGRHLTLRLLVDLPELDVRASEFTVVVREGKTLSDPVSTNAFLLSVRHYGSESNHNCRFDYRLEFATSEDYLLARDSLERFMYPERIVRVEP